MESSQWENRNHLFCRKVSLLTTPHCQLRSVGQGMKQIYLYLWYPLFQAQWDRCDQRNHQTINSEYTKCSLQYSKSTHLSVSKSITDGTIVWNS